MDAPIREKMLRFQMSVPAEEQVLKFFIFKIMTYG
jgi:hypothetical protein